MGRLTPVVVCYVLALVAAVVCVDVVFFRHQFAERLIANVGIVLVFAAFYVVFVRRSSAPLTQPGWTVSGIRPVYDVGDVTRSTVRWAMTRPGLVRVDRRTGQSHLNQLARIWSK
jgi:uncharacterized membrane protein